MSLTVYVDGAYQKFDSITNALGDALTRGKAIRPDGTAYATTTFLGGFLLDGCPLNIIFNQGWLPGQIDALKSGGILPTCLIPGTLDYFQFYGQTGVQPPTTTPPPTQLPPPTGTNVFTTPPPSGGVPPTIQVTDTPYTPPLTTQTTDGTTAPATTGPFGMDWTTLILIGVALYFLMKQSR